MRVALDTNVLVYAEGLNGADRQQAALSLVEKLSKEVTVIPVQVLGELYRVLVAKAGWSSERSRAAVLGWRDAFQLANTSESVLVDALDLAFAHQLNIWDAIIFSSAANAGCRLLLSEDLADGFIWKSVTVVNPFSSSKNPLLSPFSTFLNWLIIG